MATSPSSAPMHPSKGVQFDVNPVDPRGDNQSLGRPAIIAYFDNGAIREADGTLDTHEMWGTA